MELQIQVEGPTVSQGDVEVLLVSLQRSGLPARLSLPTIRKFGRLGELQSIEAAPWTLLVHAANAGALGVVARGVFKVILEWQKQRGEKVRIRAGKLSMEFPANASLEDLAWFIKQLEEGDQHDGSGGPSEDVGEERDNCKPQ